MKTRKETIPAAALLAPILPLAAAGQGAPASEMRAQAEKAVAALKSGASEKEKDDACRLLARVGGKEDVPAIAALLADEKLSHMARHALEPIPDPSVDDALRDAAGKLKGRPLVGVIDSIGMRKDAKAIGLLTKLLGDANPEAVSAAAVSLGRIGNSEAAKALGGALGSAPAAVKPTVCDGALRCADALAEAGKKDDAVALYDRLRAAGMPKGVRVAAMRGAILARQSAGLALFLEGIKGADPDGAAAALRVAYEWTEKEMPAALAGALPGLAPDRQALAIQALSHRASREAIAQVAPRLQDAAARETAALAILAMAERLVPTDPETAADAAKKVLGGVKNESIAKRAQQVLDRAQDKGGGKKDK